MNKKLKIVLMMLFSFSMVGCYYDEEVTFVGLPENVSLKNDVMPIFNLNCVTSGCHDAVPTHVPSLVSSNAFEALVLGNYINTLDPTKSKIYQEIEAGSMPPSGALSVNDRKIILAWITEGAKPN